MSESEDRQSERHRTLVSENAELQSRLGDALSRIAELEGAIEGHHQATFGHSACFLRDEELWAVLRDGKIRKWVRTSVPPEEELILGCERYRATLFPKSP